MTGSRPSVVAAPTISGVFRFIFNGIAGPLQVATDAFDRIAAAEHRDPGDRYYPWKPPDCTLHCLYPRIREQPALCVVQKPCQACGGVGTTLAEIGDELACRLVLPDCMSLRQRNPSLTRVPALQRYRTVRRQTLALAASLAAEDQVVQPCEEASPTKWHLGHTTWFFERFVLLERRAGYRPVDDRYERLFNSYYRTVGPLHPRVARGLLSRPTVAQIHDYRSRIDDAVIELLESRPDDAELQGLVELGLNHEEQHQELLLTDAKLVLFANLVDTVYCETAAPRSAAGTVPLEFHFEPAGFAEIGANASGFAFDNERPRHREWLEAHALGNRLVTNGEYREFVRDGGYANPNLWLADGWTAGAERGWNRPLYWSEDLEREYTLGGWRPLEPDAPVCHVSFYEAAAFAAWAGARLPTEAEWENAAQRTMPVTGNLREAGRLHPAPPPLEARGQRFLQLWGDVWEWCASAYRPYPRFRPLLGSLGEYNGKFMCNQLIARGGSCVTPAGHIRASYRNFFYPHDRWQFFGVRLARDA